jgi:hypothetical protein
MTPYQLLLSTVKIAKVHEERLRDALTRLKSILPIDETKLAQLNNDDYAYLDVMAVRYAKLQDIIGAKIFYLLLESMAESIENNRFLDVLAHLEKIGILESTNFWIDLRNVRNFIAHEYPEEPLLLIQNINNLHDCSLKLLEFWNKLLIEIQNLPNAKFK